MAANPRASMALTTIDRATKAEPAGHICRSLEMDIKKLLCKDAGQFLLLVLFFLFIQFSLALRFLSDGKGEDVENVIVYIYIYIYVYLT